MLQDYTLDYKEAQRHDNMSYTCSKTVYNIEYTIVCEVQYKRGYLLFLISSH